MGNLQNVIAACGLLCTMSMMGCASIGSAMGGNSAMTGDAWYVKLTTLFGLQLSSKVYYCPMPQSGAAQCKEARMYESEQERPVPAMVGKRAAESRQPELLRQPQSLEKAEQSQPTAPAPRPPASPSPQPSDSPLMSPLDQ